MSLFKVDENVPPFVAARLREAGDDALTVAEQGLTGTLDEDLAPICAREGRVIVTLDLGFGDVRQYPPGTGPGIVVRRPAGQDRADFEAASAMLLAGLAEGPVSGNLWIIDTHRVRVRGRRGAES